MSMRADNWWEVLARDFVTAWLGEGCQPWWIGRLGAALLVVMTLGTRAGEASQTNSAPDAQHLLYQDNFDTDLSQWVVEQAEGGVTRLKEGQLEIEDAGGCTIWFKPKLGGPVKIEFEATPVQQGGQFDRVSDLNCFWMAIDPKATGDLFANKKRGGIFRNYHPLRLYYVGYGGNNNSTTRFRRYPGDGTRPCLPEHDLAGERFQLMPNKTIRVQIISDGDRIQYLRDGEIVFDYRDPDPFTAGWFGFRTVRSHLRLDNFRVWRLPAGKPESTSAKGRP
jgi:hypothetical protein